MQNIVYSHNLFHVVINVCMIVGLNSDPEPRLHIYQLDLTFFKTVGEYYKYTVNFHFFTQAFKNVFKSFRGGHKEEETIVHPCFTQTRIILLHETDNEFLIEKNAWRSFHKYWDTTMCCYCFIGHSHSVKVKYSTTETMKRWITANIVVVTAGGESAVLLLLPA